jgi:hypothetical protein
VERTRRPLTSAGSSPKRARRLGRHLGTYMASHALTTFSAGVLTVVPPGPVCSAVERLSIAAPRLPADGVRRLRRLDSIASSTICRRRARGASTLQSGNSVTRRPARRRTGRKRSRSDDLCRVDRRRRDIRALRRQAGRLALHRARRRGVGARRLDLTCHLIGYHIQAGRTGLAQMRLF